MIFGNFVNFTRGSNGEFVKGTVDYGARTEPYFQTDVTLRHDIPVKETMKLTFEANASNIFNHHAATAYNQVAIAAQLISPSRAVRFPGDPGVDWAKVMNGYNYVDALNATGAFAGVRQAALTLANRYGMAQLFQNARSLRLQMRFTF